MKTRTSQVTNKIKIPRWGSWIDPQVLRQSENSRVPNLRTQGSLHTAVLEQQLVSTSSRDYQVVSKTTWQSGKRVSFDHVQLVILSCCGAENNSIGQLISRAFYATKFELYRKSRAKDIVKTEYDRKTTTEKTCNSYRRHTKFLCHFSVHFRASRQNGTNLEPATWQYHSLTTRLSWHMILVGKLMYLYMVYGSETDENRHFSLFTVKSCFVMRLPLRLPGSLVVCLLEDTSSSIVGRSSKTSLNEYS